MFYRQLVAVASVLATCASAEPRAMQALTKPVTTPTSSANSGTNRADRAASIPYDHVVQKSVHNAYDRFEPLLDQLVYHRVRSLELDIHTSKSGVAAAPGEWFVYHEDYPLFRDTSCTGLTDCLGQLAAFHGASPDHEVVTLFVDLKNDFVSGHDVADLDRTIGSALGRDNLVTPGDLVARCPGATSLRDAVAGKCTFPTLGALRGKFLFVTTGGTGCNAASHVRAYADAKGEHLGFAGPNVDATCPVAALDGRQDLAFMNMPFSAIDQAGAVKARGLVARAYGTATSGGLDDAADFATARAAGALHIATDKVNAEQDLWATGHGAGGFPFTCDDCGDDLRENAAVIGLRADSGDQGGATDSAMFAYERTTGRTTWTSLVSVPSSHVENLAKACLIARESDAPGAANVALCRSFDANRPRLQIRPRANEETFAIEASPIVGLTDEAPAFLRLEVEPTAAGTKVDAYVSANGITWNIVASTELDVPLPLRGISVSANGDSVKGLFANLARGRDTEAPRLVAAAELTSKAIGLGAHGLAFDGIGGPAGPFNVAMR